jgi:hypothetical protein
LTKSFLSDLKSSKIHDYKYYIDLLSHFNIVDIKETIGSGFVIDSIPIVTKRFYEGGGFISMYNKHQYELNLSNEYEEIRLRKLKWDSKLSKWQAKTFWYVFFLGVIGGICGIISLSIQLGNYKDKTKNEIIKQQQIQTDTIDNKSKTGANIL